jgi:hypothetical protein
MNTAEFFNALIFFALINISYAQSAADAIRITQDEAKPKWVSGKGGNHESRMLYRNHHTV